MTFRPIVLLNTLGKLVENIIGERLQFQLIAKNFIYLNQLGGFKQHSILDIQKKSKKSKKSSLVSFFCR